MTGSATLERPDLRLELHPRGAMIRDLQLRLPDGRWIRPLHRAPWVGTPEGDAQPGLMAGLSGEWPCIPFGTPTANLPPEWRTPTLWEDPFPHGYAANHDWTLTQTEGAVTARIEMPADHPIARMERRIEPVPGGIRCTLRVSPRRDASLPIGLHPVFRLPDEPGALEVEIAGAGQVFAHPEAPSPDPTPLAPGAVFSGLETVTDRDGAPFRLTRLPPAERCEIRALVRAKGGSVLLRNRAEGFAARLGYDADAFPAVLLWISNRGRAAKPWNTRHRALGVEPVAAPFDLGCSAANGTTPLSGHGLKLAHPFRAGQVFETAYDIVATVA